MCACLTAQRGEGCVPVAKGKERASLARKVMAESPLCVNRHTRRGVMAEKRLLCVGRACAPHLLLPACRAYVSHLTLSPHVRERESSASSSFTPDSAPTRDPLELQRFPSPRVFH